MSTKPLAIVRVACGPAARYNVESKDGERVYRVALLGTSPADHVCTCRAGQVGKVCKHIRAAIARELERYEAAKRREALRIERLQLEAILEDCADLEEPVPTRVRRRLAAVRRELSTGVSP